MNSYTPQRLLACVVTLAAHMSETYSYWSDVLHLNTRPRFYWSLCVTIRATGKCGSYYCNHINSLFY